MRQEYTLLGWELPSQNVTMRRHWRVNAKERTKLERWIRSTAGLQQPVTAKRFLHVHSIRTRLIMDDANLRGGAKGLVDAVVASGLIKDDSDDWAKITYSQATKGKKANRCKTLIIVDDKPIDYLHLMPF